MKAEKLLQVLLHITEEDLKNKAAVEVIRLIDNKIYWKNTKMED